MRDAPTAEAVAHHALQLGRLLLANGAETEQVQVAVTRFAGAFGGQAHLVVTYEALLLTVAAGEAFRTKAGNHLPGMAVDLATIQQLNALVDEAATGRLSLATAAQRLEAAERPHPVYARWAVLTCMSVTAASLARLFGGDWTVCAITLVAAACGTWVRLELGRRRANPFLIPFLAALVSGVVAALGVRAVSPPDAALCLIAVGMILVPGVPLINGVWDAIRNHMSLAAGRLAFAVLVVLAITGGLFAATLLTGVAIPVELTSPLLPVPEDALFSGLAAVGYATLFGVPPRLLWACVVCGLASHSLRTLAAHFGVDLVTGTLLASALVGCLALGFARAFRAPPAAFAFPGVVAMVPGSYAFRALIGAVAIGRGGQAAGAQLLPVAGLLVTSLLMLLMIAVGVAAPIAVADSLFARSAERIGRTR